MDLISGFHLSKKNNSVARVYSTRFTGCTISTLLATVCILCKQLRHAESSHNYHAISFRLPLEKRLDSRTPREKYKYEHVRRSLLSGHKSKSTGTIDHCRTDMHANVHIPVTYVTGSSYAQLCHARTTRARYQPTQQCTHDSDTRHNSVLSSVIFQSPRLHTNTHMS